MDAWLIAAVASEVDSACRNGRVERVSQPRPSDILLHVYAPRGSQRLLLSADPALPRAHLVVQRPANPTRPPAFCQALRRHLEGARVLSCAQPGIERSLELIVQGRDELGNPRPLRLIAELTGRLSNLVLVGPDGRIVDALRRVTEEINRFRQILPGIPYVPPPRPADRIDPVEALLTVGRDAVAQQLHQALAACAPGRPAAERLAATVFGLSPWLAAAAVSWAAGAPHAPQSVPPAADPGATVRGTAPEPHTSPTATMASADSASPPASPTPSPVPSPVPSPTPSIPPIPPASPVPPIPPASHPVPPFPSLSPSLPLSPSPSPSLSPEDRALTDAVLGIAQSIVQRAFAPCTLRAGTPSDQDSVPASTRSLPSAWPLPGWEATPAASASTACEQAYGAMARANAARVVAQRLGAALHAAQQRVAKRLAKQEAERTQAGEAEQLRCAGELLLAYGHTVPRGASEAWLPSFEDPQQSVRVALDPSRSAAANAQRLLRRYQKERRAQGQVADRVAASQDELRYLEEAALSLQQAESLEDLLALEAELAQQGIGAHRLVGRRAGRTAGSGPAGSRPPAAGRPPAPAPRLLRFEAEEGWLILVGRSAVANDHLTMKLAHPDDVWLHARQLPGSHVLLRPPAAGPGQGSPSPAALLQAARCAAHFSASRGAAHTPVDYTLRRHVWKPSGAKPGFVLYRHERTLVVGPGDLPPAIDPAGAHDPHTARGADRHGSG